MGDDWTCAGCMEETACNYDDAKIENYTCKFPEDGYNCEGTCISDSDNDDVCDGLSTYEELIPEYYNINSIYPNPFNPMATISYSISQYSIVTITVYDIIGRKLVTLISTSLNPGDYSISWDASNYPSGVYLIRMVIGSPSSSSQQRFTQTQKVVLMN